MEKTLLCKTWKTKTLAALLAVAAAVLLPQLVHGLGLVSGLGSKLGEALLPMHISILLVGFFAGAWAGLVAGVFAPLVSFALTSAWGTPMPAAAMLPFMMIELGVYGLTAGLLARTRLPAVLSLAVAQIAGRAVRALAIAIGIYLFGAALPVSVIWTSILTGLPGLLLQWILVPLILFCTEKRSRRG